jgi:hypothetical protein
MAGTPNHLARLLELNCATQMGANRGKGPPFRFADPNEQNRPAPKFHDSSAVGDKIIDLAGLDFMDCRLRTKRMTGYKNEEIEAIKPPPNSH